MTHACVCQQEALSEGSGQERRATGRTITWNGLRAALDAAAIHPQQRATTEEAFTLLVKFGQAPPCGGLLERFARNAEELRSRSLSAAPAFAGARTTLAVASVHGRNDEPDASGDGSPHATFGAGKDDEASSVLLWASEIAALAAELDPMRRVEKAFASIAGAFGGDAALAAPIAVRRQQGRYRSPLHSYAVARRCRAWKNKLDTVGSCLATTSRRLGRRGLDLLATNSGLAANAEPGYPSISLPAAAVSASELIARAKAATETATRRQQAGEADRGRGRGANGGGHESGAILTARIHRYAPILERSARGVQAFDGQGYFHRHAAASRMEGAGEPVAVLEVSPAPCRKEESTGSCVGGDGRGGGGGGKRITGESLAFVASVLSVRSLRDEPGLLNVHSEAVVIEDGRKGRRQDVAASEGLEEDCEPAADGTGAAHPRPTQIVCERLAGWRPLCNAVREHGPLVMPSDIAAGEGGEGLRVLRLWGGQLAAALECLASTSLILRDLRASTVFVSPDGSTVKVVGFLSLTTAWSEGGGIVPSEAPDLDSGIHGPTKPLTPPEALTISGGLHNRGASDNVGSRAGSPQHGVGEASLVLAGDGTPGEFPATVKWDVWTLGIMLFQLAFGHPPPAYGDCLRQGLSSLNSNISAAADGTDGSPGPTVGEMLSEIQYDFLSAVGLQSMGGRPGEAFVTTHVGNSPLENALEYMSLGAAIGERDTFHVVSAAGGRDAPLAASEISGGDGGRKTVERFRRAWVRRQLQMEERGDVDVTTWQAFQEKLKRHLNVSIAPATVATAVPSRRRKVSPQGGGDEGGGRRRVNFVDPGDDTAATPLSNKRTPWAAAEAAVRRTAARLQAADPRGTGYMPFSVARGVVCDELQLTLSTSEARLVEFCLRDSDESEHSHGRGNDGRNVSEHRRGNVRREGEGGVYYQPLVHVLHALSLPIGGHALEPQRPAYARHDSLPPPTPTAFVEVLCACLEPNPDRRLCARSLLRLPFFSRCDMEREAFKNTNDLRAASAYIGGSGSETSTTLALRERVECRIEALEAGLSDGAPIANKEKSQRADAARTIRGVGCDSKNFGAGALVEALKELEQLVHRSSPGANYLTENDHPQQTRRVARSHARVMDEVFESGVLTRASALALRFLGREEVRQVCLHVPSLKFRRLTGIGFPTRSCGLLEHFQSNVAAVSPPEARCCLAPSL